MTTPAPYKVGGYRRMLRRGQVKDGRVWAALGRYLQEVPVNVFGHLRCYSLSRYGEANNRMLGIEVYLVIHRRRCEGLARDSFKNMAQNTTKKHCGQCGEVGHSIRTCQEMKAVSAARLKILTFRRDTRARERGRLPKLLILQLKRPQLTDIGGKATH
jgi:hypothetical protein